MDLGFGDAITPKPLTRVLPCLLDFAPPHLRVYPWETVVAEKYQAMVDLGMTNSRMKDFFDLRHLAREFEFDGATLSRAVRATFERRNTDIPTEVPHSLGEGFTQDPTARTRWAAFLRRSRLPEPGLDLSRVAEEIGAFLKPLTEALYAGTAFDKTWKRGGPWR